MPERSRSLTFQPGEILKKRSIHLDFFFTSRPPSRENCGGVFTNSSTALPRPPPGPTLHGQKTDSEAEGGATRLGCSPRCCRPGESFSRSMVRGFIFRSTHMLSSTLCFALIELLICTPCCWQLNGTMGRAAHQHVSQPLADRQLPPLSGYTAFGPDRLFFFFFLHHLIGALKYSFNTLHC